MKRYLILMVMGSLCASSFIGCTSKEKQVKEVYGFSHNAKDAIVKKLYGGGQNIQIATNSYSYNSYTNSYRIDVKISWQGSFFSSNRYWADGFLVANRKTKKVEWTPVLLSSSLQSYLSNRGLAEGLAGAAAIVVVANELSKE